jgi:hypothetical protein
MKDLYHQDLIEMIERETRQFEMWEILDPSDPDFPKAYEMLWGAFGPIGEMEREDVIRQFLKDDNFEPMPTGTYVRYFLLAARDTKGNIRGVRDGSVLVNPAYAPDLCMVFLSHIYMREEARGTVLSYWLRIAPIEIAVQYLQDLHARGKIKLPAPDQPGKYFGMRMNLCAEMEYFAPEDRLSWQRILFYGRGGFDAINPRHFPYQQPDFREPEVIRTTENRPLPFMFLTRRLGNERQAWLAIDEASAMMRLVYDDFACHVPREFLENSLQLVLDRLAERAKTKSFVELLPLPTGVKDLGRLKRLWKPRAFTRYYGRTSVVEDYLQAQPRERQNPRWLDGEIQKIAAELESRPRFVYANRDRDYTWDGQYAPEEPPAADLEMDMTMEEPMPLRGSS